jgi:hypothetical protein
VTVAIRISLFGGIIPRLADRGLPDNAAQYAMNAKLASGELRAWNKLKPLSTLPISNAKTVYHYRHLGDDQYLAFAEPTNVVKAPLVNETLGRMYWTNSLGPQVNTGTRIAASNPAFALGVPPPAGSFTVAAAGGTSDTVETRVYVATLVTSFGEEGPPGSAVTVSGRENGTFTVNGLNSLSYNSVKYANVTHLRLYRTLSSATGVDYRQVIEWPIGSVPASYNDTVTNVDVADNTPLQSLGWGLPPDDLQGLISVAGGFLAGFTDRTVRFSVPYYPHAWPEDTIYAVEDKIVALQTYGNTVVVLTEGRGALLVGPSPDAMTLMKMDGVQPCLSARSAVVTVAGVMYASTDGLVLIDGSSNTGQIVSRGWVTKDEWLSQFNPSTQMAAVYQDRYLAFYSDQLGFTVGFDDAVTGYTELQLDGVSSVDLDVLTGQTLVTIGDTVYEWDGDNTQQMTYVWRSKPFLQVKPCNFAALQLRGTFIGAGTPPPDIPPIPATGRPFNTRGLNAAQMPELYGGAMNGPALWQAMGIAPDPGTGPAVLVKLFCDGVQRWAKLVVNEDPLRLPSGFKGVRWEVEVTGSVPIYSVTLADTLKGLEQLP